MITAKAVVMALAIAAISLHGYESFILADLPSPGFFLWLLLPYGIAAIFLWRLSWYVPVSFGMGAALILDFLNHYAVFVESQSSTAALGMVFIPLWSAILVVPATILIARAVMRRRTGASRAL